MGAGREEGFSRENSMWLEQGFSASTLLALGVRSFLVMGAVLGIVGYLAPLTSSHYMPRAPSPAPSPHHDEEKCL